MPRSATTMTVAATAIILAAVVVWYPAEQLWTARDHGFVFEDEGEADDRPFPAA